MVKISYTYVLMTVQHIGMYACYSTVPYDDIHSSGAQVEGAKETGVLEEEREEQTHREQDRGNSKLKA